MNTVALKWEVQPSPQPSPPSPLPQAGEGGEPDFLAFKLAAELIGEAALDAEDWDDITIPLENAFSHPLYSEDRELFAEKLIAALDHGIQRALE